MLLVNWQQFGLKKNPYDTLPLIEGGELPIDKAFVGRKLELDFLNKLFLSSNNICLTICGNVGVGKTSLINFHKYKFKYLKTNKLLFSFRREIEAAPELISKRNFLIEIIGSILREIQLIQPDLIHRSDFLKRLQKIVDISQSMSFSAGLSGGFNLVQLGGNIGKEVSIDQPIQLSMATLEQYYIDLINFIKKNKIGKRQYNGLIIHVNNFDVLLADKISKKKVIHFFHEIRDLIQLPDTYYVFLGPRELFKDVVAHEKRIKSIFVQSPLMLDPLSKHEIIEAFNERMILLKSEDVMEYVKPFEDDVIYRLYDLYKGDIRSIMSALKDILGQFSYKLGKTLTVDESMILLGRERWERIEATANLTFEQKEILKYLATAEGIVTQKDLVKILNKTPESISGYYFKPLRENGIIEEKKKVGTIKYWGLTETYYPIRFILDSKRKVDTQIQEIIDQMKLF